MSSAPFLFLSPALPSELLTFILNHHAYPTTLIICSSRQEFLASLIDDVCHETTPTPSPDITSTDQQQHGIEELPPSTAAPETNRELGGVKQRQKHHSFLASSPLYQVATSRHIRVVYVPTVTHLRAYLSVFSPDDTNIPAPPPDLHHNSSAIGGGATYTPRIVLYGFLSLHRDTSEWSAQGLGNSASAVVDLGHRLSWQAIIVEPRKRKNSLSLFEDLLEETVPFLSGGGRRPGPDSRDEGGGWIGRTVEVGRVMKRWFRFQHGVWDASFAAQNEAEDVPRNDDDRNKIL